MSITPKPITVKDHIDQSRDISGFNKWARTSRSIEIVMFILGWFTIPAEVFLRHNFGQRWFTVANFFAGALLLLIFGAIESIWTILSGLIGHFMARMEDLTNMSAPHYQPPTFSFEYLLLNNPFFFYLLLYLMLGSYELFKIWWRDRTNNPIHSYDDGTSRFRVIMGIVIWVANVIAIPIVALATLLLPRTLYAGIKRPKLINDRPSFITKIFEPLLLIAVTTYLSLCLFSIWLVISAVALVIHANWKETAQKSKLFNMRDAIIHSNAMRALKDQAQQKASALSGKTKSKKKDAIAVFSGPKYPDVMYIIEQMHEERNYFTTDRNTAHISGLG